MYYTLDLRWLFSLFRLAIDSRIVYNTKHENETNGRKQEEQLNIRYYQRKKILRRAPNTRQSVLTSSRDSPWPLPPSLNPANRKEEDANPR